MSRRSPVRRRRAVATVGVLAVLAGCAIQPDAAPRDIPEEDRGSFGAETATGDVTAGSSLIFLSAPHETGTPQLLRSAMRDVPSTAAAVVRSLLAGPEPDRTRRRIRHRDPRDPARCNSVRTPGSVATIDINDALDELDAVDLRYAVAQIVFTVAAIDNVDAVLIRVDGEVRAWPRGDGELTSDPLTPYDYPGLVESTQPAYPAVPRAADETAERTDERSGEERLGDVPKERDVDRSGLADRDREILELDAVATQHGHLPPRPLDARRRSPRRRTGSTAPDRTPSACRHAGHGRAAPPAPRSPCADRSLRRCGSPHRRARRVRTGRRPSPPSRGCPGFGAAPSATTTIDAYRPRS